MPFATFPTLCVEQVQMLVRTIGTFEELTSRFDQNFGKIKISGKPLLKMIEL